MLSGKGEHGFDDKHRGQMMVVTGESYSLRTLKTQLTIRLGPMLCAGEELATAATQALGAQMQFDDISQ